LKKPFAELLAMRAGLAGEPEAKAEAAFVEAAIAAFEAYRARLGVDPGPGYFRAVTAERRKSIERFYEQAALTMSKGFYNRMARYAAQGDARARRIAAIWASVEK
jgi:hypothetical protein